MNSQDLSFARGWNWLIRMLDRHIHDGSVGRFEENVFDIYFDADYPQLQTPFNDGLKAAFLKWIQTNTLPEIMPGF